jgi:hypothetical protein
MNYFNFTCQKCAWSLQRKTETGPCQVFAKWIKTAARVARCCWLLIVELYRIAVSNVGRDEEVRRGGGGGGRSGRRDEPRRHTLSGDHHHHQQGGALARSMDLEVSVVPVLHVQKRVLLHFKTNDPCAACSEKGAFTFQN